MAAAVDKEIAIDVATVEQLFNAPAADPFAAGRSVVLGVAALDLVVTQLQVHPLRNWDGVDLIVRLPGDQVTPDLEQSLAEAVRRYCEARIEDNHLRVSLSRKQRIFGLTVVLTIVLTVILVVPLLFATVFAGASASVQGFVAGMLSLFGWVIIWDPLQSLLFEWAPPARENRALARVMNMRVVVQERP